LTNPSLGLVYECVETANFYGVTAAAIAILASGCAVPEPPAAPNNKSYFAEVCFSTDSDGSVGDVRIVRSDAPAALKDWTVATVRKWRFEPGPPASATRTIRFDRNDTQNGNAVPRDLPR
jgi:TonB family protein